MPKDSRYTFSINQALDRALSLSAGEIGQSKAEFIRRAILEQIIAEVRNYEKSVADFILCQTQKALQEIPDSELNSKCKSKLLQKIDDLQSEK